MIKGQKDDGFSLVEMLVVLSLIALTLVIVMPYAPRSGDAQKLHSSAQIIAANLRATQARALASNLSQTLKIDVRQGKVLGANKREVFQLPRGVLIKIVTAKNEIVDDVAAFRFFADGGSNGGSITLTLEDRVQVISLNWLHGGVFVSAEAKQ